MRRSGGISRTTIQAVTAPGLFPDQPNIQKDIGMLPSRDSQHATSYEAQALALLAMLGQPVMKTKHVVEIVTGDGAVEYEQVYAWSPEEAMSRTLEIATQFEEDIALLKITEVTVGEQNQFGTCY